ncbi:ectoine/hydroxyectoine ABC transporter substrate-binding protein EhuB [Pararhodobacter sp.]|uniref:ectoine/hydroxyectoine ABC transporter substrate-binding protein EhuB n=1 Tax=Pararhodobacter sp. TaxID=2127056 RepID=UPI002FDDDDE0
MFTRRFVLAAGLAAGTFASGLAAHADTASELAARLPGGTVTIGIHNRSPWGFRDLEGDVTGYHPDLVRAALAPLGIENIEFVVSEFGALIPGLNANRFDMIASGIAITPERCQQVIFSEPDLSVGDGLVVRAGNPMNIHSYADIVANPGIMLAGGRGTLNSRNAMEAGVPEAQMLLLPESNDLVSAVLAGRAHAATLSAPSVVGMLADPNLAGRGLERAEPFTGLLREDGTPAAMYTAIAFRPEDTVLRDIYNESLAELIASGALQEIMGRYGFTEAELPPSRTTADICGQ